MIFFNALDLSLSASGDRLRTVSWRLPSPIQLAFCCWDEDPDHKNLEGERVCFISQLTVHHKGKSGRN